MVDDKVLLPGPAQRSAPTVLFKATNLLLLCLLLCALPVLSNASFILDLLFRAISFFKHETVDPSFSLSEPSAAPRWIVPGARWLDTEGNSIQAHGGGMLKVDDVLYGYWFGEDKEHHASTFRAVSCYVSADLYTWTRLPDALVPLVGTSVSNESIVERPKVLHNSLNNDYVMWFHSDNLNYNAAEVGVAVSPTPEGPYTFLCSFKPFGADSRDIGLFVDDDENAYLLYASDWNNNFKIAQLTPDYRNVSNITHVFYGGGYEAPGIIKKNGTYHLFISGLTGWWPNANRHLSAPSLSGPWSEPEDIAPPLLRTYFSQNTYDLVIERGESEGRSMVSLFMGDRWKSNRLGRSSYVWLPMMWHENATVWLDWVDVFSMDLKTGAIVIPNGTTYHAAHGILSRNARVGKCASCTSKLAVYRLGAGGCVTIHGIQGNGAEHWVSLYYANPDRNWRETTVSVNGGPTQTVEQPDTQDSGAFLSVPVRLMLMKSSKNNITIGHNQTSYAGNLDKIIVYPV
ncbi:galactan 1-3-beta-galactosidase [Dacryopinax primogenitus]|uniref:Galactan 1-3-beta-galactosidase n=1 Tax=Dacryopinax primogenitus (strain DJM 731) TaxID=1858805 RepID=M5GEH5_DACPD|nr:galactan 1-3-beta-galactosidase [Dacryopinax primogenitus]EJU03258.1 galactan 1-3-beta-galactosidase [Dacryopinax primogenitus]